MKNQLLKRKLLDNFDNIYPFITVPGLSKILKNYVFWYFITFAIFCICLFKFSHKYSGSAPYVLETSRKKENLFITVHTLFW